MKRARLSQAKRKKVSPEAARAALTLPSLKKAERNMRVRKLPGGQKKAARIFTRAQMKQAALNLRVHKFLTVRQIAEALEISTGMVTSLLNEARDELEAESRVEARQLLSQEIARIEELLRVWVPIALRGRDHKAAKVALDAYTRLHKITGLEVTRSEVSGPGGGPIGLSPIKPAALTDAELLALEQMAEKSQAAGGGGVTIDAVPVSVGGNEDDSPDVQPDPSALPE